MYTLVQRSEGLPLTRTCEVTDAVGNQIGCIRYRPLGRPRTSRRTPRQRNDERSGVQRREVDADEASYLVLLRQSDEHRGAYEGWQSPQHHDIGSVALPFARQNRRAWDRCNLQDTRRDVEECRLQRVEAELLDDDGPLLCQTVGDIGEDRVEAKGIQLPVGQRLDELLLFEVLILGARLVGCDALQSNGSLLWGQEPRRGRSVGEQEEVDDEERKSHETEDQEEGPPGSPVANLRVLDTVGDEGIEDDGQAVHEEPHTDSDRLLIDLVIGRREEQETRCDDAFSDAQHETQHEQPRKAVGAQVSQNQDSPGEDGPGEHPTGRQSLQQGADGELKDQIRDVEDAGAQVVPTLSQVVVLFQSQDGGVP